MQTQKNEEEAVAGERRDVRGGFRDQAAELTIALVAPPPAAPSDQGSTSLAALKEMANDLIVSYKSMLERTTAREEGLLNLAGPDGPPKETLDDLRDRLAIFIARQQHVDMIPHAERLLTTVEAIPGPISGEDLQVAQQEFRDKAATVEATLSMLEASLNDDSSPLRRKLVEISNEGDSQPDAAKEKVKKLVMSPKVSNLRAVIKNLEVQAHLKGMEGLALAAAQDGEGGQQEGEQGKGGGAEGTTTAADQS